MRAIDADQAELSEADRQAIAEFETSFSPQMKAQLGLAKLWDTIEKLLDFTAPTRERLDAVHAGLMARKIRERSGSILVAQYDEKGRPLHPLVDPKTERMVALVDSPADAARLWFWAARLSEREIDRQVAEAKMVVEVVRRLRTIGLRFAARVGKAIAGAFYFGTLEDHDDRDR